MLKFDSVFSLEEKNMMKYYIDHYASSVNKIYNIAESKLPYIFKPWEDAKNSFLYKLLGNKLIYEEVISTDTPIHASFNSYRQALYTNRKAEVFIERIIEAFCKANPIIANVMNDFILSPVSIITNKYLGPQFSIMDTTKNKEIVFRPNEKISKILGKLSDIFEIPSDLYEEWRLEHSRVLNKRAQTNTLCLSIHPLDYMTMSDNNNDWTSCMSWQDCGCYRQGTVEMMNSPMVLVAYFKSSKDMFIDSTNTWFSKKWRELFIVNEDIICNVKGYPYCWPENEQKIIEIIKRLAKENLGYDYSETSLLGRSKCGGSNFCFNDKIDMVFTTDIMYNDFGSCSHYAAISPNLNEDYYECCYSGVNECMICGETMPQFGNYEDDEFQNRLVCHNCEEIRYCSCCDYTILTTQEDWYTVEDEILCEECFYECKTSILTGELILPQNIITYHIISSEQKLLDKLVTPYFYLHYNDIPELRETIGVNSMTNRSLIVNEGKLYINKDNFSKIKEVLPGLFK